MTRSPFTWRRTDINGEELERDFCAFNDAGEICGRIYQENNYPNKGKWRWSMTVMRPGVPYPSLPPRSGMVPTKSEAVQLVIECYEMVMSFGRESRQDKAP